MKTFALPMILLAGMFLVTAPAQALLSHTWVGFNGNDGALCDRSNPCATFTGAFSKTEAGGEITCVDSGNYGGLTISHSITINCENAIGSNNSPPGVGYVLISGTTASDIVNLRGLDFDGTGFS